jgi:hypothetical protein
MPRSSLSSTLRAMRFLALFCAAIVTLRAQAPPAVPKLAVEIRDAPGEEPFVQIVTQDEDLSWEFSNWSFLPLPGFESKEHPPAQPSDLDIYFHLHGDVMDIEAKVKFAPRIEGDALGTEEHRLEVELGSYRGRVGDTISFDKLTELGFRPATIKIVSPERQQATSLPIVVHVPSITARVASQDHTGYKIVLHNLSAQGVTAFEIKDALSGGAETRSELSGGRPVIAANENYEYELDCRDDVDTGTSDDDREQGSCAFVLTAAVFADGSYEGDVDAAAMLEMNLLAGHSQVLRVHQALQAVLDDKDALESSRIARMRTAVSNLSYQPDPTIREQLRSKFPGVSDSVLAQIDENLRIDLDSMKVTALGAMRSIDDSPESTKALAELLALPEMN